jgi:DNA-binding NarL/FixJ family response regulator
VITFQADELPSVRYSLQFGSLAQARSYFSIPTAKEAGLASKVGKAQRLKAQGWSKKEIAKELGVSLSTIKRYLRRGGSSSLLTIV